MKTQIVLAIFLLFIGIAASQLCGEQPYDPVSDLCCTNVLHAGKNVAGELCCGDKSFDPVTHECKWGTISQRSIHDTMTCSANGTIVLMNDDPDLYTSAKAMQGALTAAALQCTVDISENPKIVISGCPPSSEITLFLSSTAIDLDIVGGHSTNLRSVIIQCTGIPLSGINVTVVNQMGAQVTVPTVTYTAAPYLSLESKIWNPDTLQFTSQEMAGTSLIWSIKLPAEGYSGLPLSCTAYSGTSRAGRPKKQIISDGCSLKKELIGDWSVLTDKGVYGLSAPLWAFSFYNSPSVYFRCLLRICPPGSTACAFSCDGRRRKRAVEYPDDSDMRETAVTLVILTKPVYMFPSSASEIGVAWFLIGSCVSASILKYAAI